MNYESLVPVHSSFLRFGLSTSVGPDLTQELKEEMINTQAELTAIRETHARRLASLEATPAKRSRTSANIERAIDSQTAQLHLAIKCKAAFTHMPSTLAEAVNLFVGSGQMDFAGAAAALDSIVADWTLTKHALLCDQALDRVLAEEIERGRDSTFFGVGLSSDESPPEGMRFCSFRFQVTMVFIPWIPDSATWSDPAWASNPPIRVQQRLVDIVHCPSKDGKAVANAVQLQMQGLGLTLDDIHSGTGDGGGEMEGSSGLHKVLELSNCTYVRRRCWAHLSWRCVDSGIAIMSAHDSLNAFLNYLRETGTWLRLQAIAVQQPHDGGLHITHEGSQLFKLLFSAAPPRIVDGRPESVSIALKWLLPKEEEMAKAGSNAFGLGDDFDGFSMS